MTLILDGKVISQIIKAEIKVKTHRLFTEKGVQPGLAVLMVGENPASVSYVNSKEKACLELGFKSIVKRLISDVTENEIIEIVDNWNKDNTIHGILVQMPLPNHIDENKVILKILPSKDVDGFHPENFGRLVIGLPGFIPCTPEGIMELLKRYDININGKHVVVVGRSNIVGKPIANLLYQKNKDANAIVTICHTGAEDIYYYTKQADILIAAMGKPLAIKSEHIKKGAVVIDVGINRVDDDTTEKGYKLVGDIDYDDVFDKVSAITPVPGGVGLMTIAMLMQNTFKSAAGEVY